MEQIKELYVNEMIDDLSFIASASESDQANSEQSKSNSKSTGTDSPFRILPSDSSLWTPIRDHLALFSELEDAITSSSKTRKNKATAIKMAGHKANGDATSKASNVN